MTELTGAQRLVYGLGHAISRYRLGSNRRPDQIKFDMACLIADHCSVFVKGFDSDEFFKACGYSNRKAS